MSIDNSTIFAVSITRLFAGFSFREDGWVKSNLHLFIHLFNTYLWGSLGVMSTMFQSTWGHEDKADR